MGISGSELLTRGCAAACSLRLSLSGNESIHPVSLCCLHNLLPTLAQISCGEDCSAVSESAGHHAGGANLILEIMSNCGSVCLLLLFSNIFFLKRKQQNISLPRPLAHFSDTIFPSLLSNLKCPFLSIQGGQTQVCGCFYGKLLYLPVS